MAIKHLVINGRAINGLPSGHFVVSRRRLQGQDFRALPPNTSLVIPVTRTRSANSTRVGGIIGPDPAGFSVVADYAGPRGPHALSYEKYMDVAKELFVQAAAVGITYVDSFEENEVIHHALMMTRGEFTIDDIEVAVIAEVDKVLDQLTAFTLQMDQQVRKQFHV